MNTNISKKFGFWLAIEVGLLIIAENQSFNLILEVQDIEDPIGMLAYLSVLIPTLNVQLAGRTFLYALVRAQTRTFDLSKSSNSFLSFGFG